MTIQCNINENIIIINVNGYKVMKMTNIKMTMCQCQPNE
jgi:hypothetical protein